MNIIIDGSSSDGTLEIINDYKSKNKSVKLFSRRTMSVYAFNKGLSLATGDIIGFLHSDDVS